MYIRYDDLRCINDVLYFVNKIVYVQCIIIYFVKYYVYVCK